MVRFMVETPKTWLRVERKGTPARSRTRTHGEENLTGGLGCRRIDVRDDRVRYALG
jgi:hypothetical protein